MTRRIDTIDSLQNVYICINSLCSLLDIMFHPYGIILSIVDTVHLKW